MKIDVIIPAYKAQNTIIRTLSSLAMQSVVKDLKITIVNDCDGEGYQHFVDMFSPYMDIQELVMEKNGGPGDARQYGIDHTDNPLLTFIDADDTFAGAYALHILRSSLLPCRFLLGLNGQGGSLRFPYSQGRKQAGIRFLRKVLNTLPVSFG